jgi:outer membrane protein TolC
VVFPKEIRAPGARTYCLALFCLVGVIYSSRGSTAELGSDLKASKKLSWKACIDEVAQNNAEIRSARETWQATEFSKTAARSGFYPQLNGIIGYSYGKGTTVDSSALSGAANSVGGVSSSKNESTYSTSISLNQNLFSGFQDSGKVSQATANARAARAQYDLAKAKISSDLKSAYSGLLFAQRAIELEHEVVRRRENNLRLVDLRFQGGRENKGSLLLSKAYLEQANYEDLQAHNNIRVYQTQLARVLGRDDNQEKGRDAINGTASNSRVLVLDISPEGAIPLENPNVIQNFVNLVGNTPEHFQVVAQLEATRSGTTLAQAGFYPSLNLIGSAGKFGHEWLPQSDRWSIGLTLSIPIFSGGKDYYGVQAASLLQTAAEANRINIDRVILAKLEQTNSTYLEAIAKLRVDLSFREAALKRSEIARSKYENGLMTFEDWDLIENDLIVRERAVLQTQRDLVLAEAAWVLATGKGVIP